MTTSLKNWVSRAFNSSVIEKDRFLWVDYLRGIIIILVVYHHAFLGMVKNGISVPQSIVDANMAAYSFRMPLFFIFSGIFTGLSLSYKPLKDILWNKFNILFYPYVVWCIIQITLQIIFSQYTTSNGGYRDYLNILYQPKALAHFWYLPALFNATMIFALIKNKLRIKTGQHLLLGLLFFLVAPFINEISMISNWMRFYIFLVIGDAITPFILRKEIQVQLKKPYYFLVIIPIFVLAQLYYFNVIGVRSLENDSSTLQINYAIYTFRQLGFLIISLIGCITFALLSFLIEKWNRLKWLRVIGYHSLYIYIMHVIIVAFARTVLVNVFETDNYLVVLLVSISFGVTVPILFYNLIGKKYLWFLFSTEKKQVRDRSRLNKDPNLRSSEIRISPLQPTVNNI